jgi:hypothetical protein
MRILRYTLIFLLLIVATLIDPCVLQLHINARAAKVYRLTSQVNVTIKRADTPKSTHKIEQETMFGMGTCSATAIGKHALLTATHCELSTDELDVDGVSVKIVQRLRDGNDHTIYLIEGKTFTDIAAFSPNALQLGDPVFLWGNPRGLVHLYRQGFYAGKQRPPGKPFWPDVLMFDLNIGPGDSGGALFNSNGEIVAVVSMMFNPGDIYLATCFPLKFSAEQLKIAREF